DSRSWRSICTSTRIRWITAPRPPPMSTPLWRRSAGPTPTLSTSATAVADRRLCLAAAIVVMTSLPAAAQPLVADGEIALPDVRGRIDHLAFDPQRRRLLVAELGNNTVDIVDLAAGRAAGRITGLAEPQGVGFAPRAGRYVVANAKDGTVRFYRAEDLAPAGAVELGSDADNLRIDPGGNVLAGYGGGGIATIDSTTLTKTVTVALPAHP